MPSIQPSASFWSDQDIQVLEDFLMGEGAPENAMDVSMMDGFITAIVSGPNLIMPGEALRWVWDCERGQGDVVFRDQAQAAQIFGLFMQQWNAIATSLSADPQAYEPLLLENPGGPDGPVTVIDEWCMGYCLGMNLDRDSWAPLLQAHPDWLGAPLLYGTESGWEVLEKEPLSAQEHQALADGLADMVRRVHGFWLARRAMPSGAPPVRREGAKMGRNELCHCGSGKKYKHCHGTH